VDSTYTSGSGRNILQFKINGTDHQTVSIAGGNYLPRLIFSGASTTVYGPLSTAYANNIEITAGNIEYIGQGGQFQFLYYIFSIWWNSDDCKYKLVFF
jgi:hypothetical protein